MENNLCLDKYISIRYISKGRFGTVYEVYNKELQIHTALKMEIESDNISDQSLHNEVKNFKILSKYQVSNIPTYYDSGICQNGEMYIELELFDGDLKTFIENNVITKYELYDILFELLYTLYEFRVIGFEHRDVKTNNVVYKINNNTRNYILNDTNVVINSIIHPIIIDFNHSGLTANRHKTLFRMTNINYVTKDLQKLVHTMKKLIKITENLSTQEVKNITLFVNNLIKIDDATSTFIYKMLLKLYEDFLH